MEKYLQPTYYIDSDNQIVREIAEKVTKNVEKTNDKAKKIFYWTRDKIRYNPYESFSSRKSKYKASQIIQVKKGWCVQKACVLAALARVINIPSRLHFADIRNFQISDKLKEIMGMDVFIFHGYTEILLNEKWIKLTPAFNIELCKKFNQKTVEFDGINDAILPKTTLNGEKHIEYVRDRGIFIDFPYNEIFNTLHEYYEFV